VGISPGAGSRLSYGSDDLKSNIQFCEHAALAGNPLLGAGAKKASFSCPLHALDPVQIAVPPMMLARADEIIE
jgi:hypothetical protein